MGAVVTDLPVVTQSLAPDLAVETGVEGYILTF